MANPKLTPEEKLLRVIESPTQGVRGMRSQRRPVDFKLSLKLLEGKYKEKFRKFLHLRTVNYALVLLALVTTLFLLLDFWFGLPSANDIMSLEKASKTLDIGPLIIEGLDPSSFYLQEIGQRNIFALVPPKATGSSETSEPSIEMTSLIEGLKIVGIIWSESPQAIIEDTKENKTYLLNRGGKLKQARVKDILKDSVILSYDNHEIELK